MSFFKKEKKCSLMIYLAFPTMSRGLLSRSLNSYMSLAADTYQIRTMAHYNGILPCSLADVHTASAKNIGVTPALHELYNLALLAGAQDSDFILFSHDDVEMMEPKWDERLRGLIAERPNMALFGFGGARGLGDPDLYQKPYQLQQLARRDFISNLKSAEQHGRRVLEPTRVATLDLFTIGARVSFLKEIGGWAWWPHVHHSLDNAICLEALRRQHEIWMFPIACEHFGGMTSTRTDFMKDFGIGEGEIHSKGHETLYERYRGILPVWVE